MRLVLKINSDKRKTVTQIYIAQDRRYWIIHSITIPSLFVGGVIFMLSGFVYKLFGALNFNKYFDKDNIVNIFNLPKIIFIVFL